MNIKDFFKALFQRGFFKRRGEAKLQIKNYEALGSEQREMIQGVFEFGETTVKEIMVPRIDTVFLDAQLPFEEALDVITQSGHSRFPVYKETLDNVIGVIYSKDVLKFVVSLMKNISRREDFNIENLMHKAHFVPESKHIDALFREFQSRHVHIAVVSDEYGGVSGIVSMENILEEIVGDIQDEFDNEREDIIKTGEGSYLCDARCSLDDFEEALGVELPAEAKEDVETLGGFVFDLFGKIPAKNETVKYEDKEKNLSFTFTVQDIEGRKITNIKVDAAAPT